MGDVMPAVPGIHGDSLVRRKNTAMLRVAEPALEVGRLQLGQQQQPALVQGLEQAKRGFDRSCAGVRQLGPSGFFVRPDGRLLLRERELDAGIRVEVAVGNMMHHLAHRPAAGPVGCVELRGGQSGNGFAKVRWGSGNLSNPPLPAAGSHVSVELKGPDGVPEVVTGFRGLQPLSLGLSVGRAFPEA